MRKTLNILFSGVSSEFSTENSLISDDVMEIINNPQDKKKLDDAVEYLLNHKSEKTYDLELSNQKITISLG
ncbi:hypothetical protein [Flavobacterium celericrescens]|uniref:Uncharacterized protein n=1 Tax=Flavobacterium celericrescens TaxID=2709780 RepID=A0ABX0IBP6_9FLAO|nr:hypothetical protein [Flavobacterium celericrescens]NHM03284.1 hypothetical protein [Flavobacterium celericrescens]